MKTGVRTIPVLVILIFETRKDNTLAERMRLVTDGKLGVGISTPDCRVHIMDGDAERKLQRWCGADS